MGVRKGEALLIEAVDDNGRLRSKTVTDWHYMTSKSKSNIRAHLKIAHERGFTQREIVGLDKAPILTKKQVAVIKKVEATKHADKMVMIDGYRSDFLKTRLVPEQLIEKTSAVV